MAKRIMSRSFTKREKVLILILSIILLAATYYFFVIQNVAATKAANEAQLAEIENEITIQSALVAKRTLMLEEIDKLGQTKDASIVAPYDNLSNELAEFNTILANTSAYDLKWSQPTFQGETVRRAVALTFTTRNYNEALAIVDALQNGKYRCAVTEISLTSKMLADGTVESVSGTLNVTYYETTTGSTNLSGLVQKKEEEKK